MCHSICPAAALFCTVEWHAGQVKLPDSIVSGSAAAGSGVSAVTAAGLRDAAFHNGTHVDVKVVSLSVLLTIVAPRVSGQPQQCGQLRVIGADAP